MIKLETEGKVTGEVFKSDGHITPSIFNTECNVSLSAKSISNLRSAARPNFQHLVVNEFANQPTRSANPSSTMRSKCGEIKFDTGHSPPVATVRQQSSTSVSSENSNEYLATMEASMLTKSELIFFTRILCDIISF